jgi:thiosulfate dehydrogenase [quinone] large subunit
MIDRLSSKSRASIKRWPIVLLRVYTGVFFAWHGVGKISRGNFSESMQGFLNSQLENSFGFYRPIIESVVLPNSVLFGNLVAWGELLIGVALIVGLATRYAAFAGAFLVANFWFAKGAGILDGTNHDVVWLVVLVVLGTIPAGRIAGLDDGLSDRMHFLR